MDLQLPVQSVFITTKVVSSNLLRRGVLDTTLCDTICQCLAAGRWFSPGTPVSSINKTDRHDITEILLKVALNTITLALSPSSFLYALYIIEHVVVLDIVETLLAER